MHLGLIRQHDVSEMLTSNPKAWCVSQGGALHGPGDQASQHGGIVQMGGENPSGRTKGHARHRANARQAGLRPPC